MEINELNLFNGNNNQIATLDTNNLFISDELAVDEKNNVIDGTKYAADKRSSKASKAISFVALSMTALLAGSLMLNSFIGSDPVINNFAHSYSVEGNMFNYSFDVTISSSTLIMKISGGTVELDKIKFNKTGVYEDSIELEYNSEYMVKFYSSNGFDYTKEIANYGFSFKTTSI
jgi:hypothetical protein